MRFLVAIPIMALATVVLFPARVTRESVPRPRIDRIEPEAARPGDLVEASGVNLGRSFVLDLILANVDQSVLTHIVAHRTRLSSSEYRALWLPGCSAWSWWW